MVLEYYFEKILKKKYKYAYEWLLIQYNIDRIGH